MQWGLLGAFLASFAYGVGTILQTIGARGAERTERVDVRLLWRLAHSLPFLGGLGCDAVAFVLSLAALRSLPLFVVQAVISASLAVTALLAALLLRYRLRLFDWGAVAVVSVGLALLATAAGHERPAAVDFGGRLSLLVGVAALAGVAAGAGRIGNGHALGGWALACVAGLAYSCAGIGARILHHPSSLPGLVSDPAAWAMIGSGLLGILLYATAVQRASVTLVTGTVTVTETVFPAAIGVALLGDRPRAGFMLVAALGFALTVLGALGLARYGELSPAEGAALASQPKAGPLGNRHRP